MSKIIASVLIHQYEREYTAEQQPIRIDFRKLFPKLNKSERYTHQIHTYPAKLIPHIPYFFLSTDYFCPDDGVVLDPFCGSGTVLLEAQLAHRKAIGADANPLAVAILVNFGTDRRAQIERFHYADNKLYVF